VEVDSSRFAGLIQTEHAGSFLILLPFENSLIDKQAKWPLDLPLTFLVIVSPDDMLSQ